MTSRSESRWRRQDPGWRTLKEMLDDGRGGPTASYVANVLYAAGFKGPEQFRRITDEEIEALLIGRKGKDRVRVLRAKLNRGELGES